MKQIPLSRGLFAMVDDADFEFLNQWKWYAHVFKDFTPYAIRNSKRPDGGKTTVKMHRAILGDSAIDAYVDHINGNGLDNRRENLRVCTHAENAQNSRTPSNNTSGWKGACYCKKRRMYESYIRIGGKKKHLGRFFTAREAARAYNDAAIFHYGEFARLNQL